MKDNFNDLEKRVSNLESEISGIKDRFLRKEKFFSFISRIVTDESDDKEE